MSEYTVSHAIEVRWAATPAQEASEWSRVEFVCRALLPDALSYWQARPFQEARAVELSGK